MRSFTNILFITLLVFASSSTELFDTTADIDLENVPAFLELSSHPISQAFFSAVALRMKDTAANGGFQKVMSLIEELIRDNKRQIQRIRKINHRVEGECMVTTHKLKDRNIFFSGQRSYFHARGAVSIEEKGEALNVMTSRNSQRTAYAALQAAAKASHDNQDKKWGMRIQNAQNGVSKVNAALRAINDWTPKTNPAFIQQLVKETTELYTKVKNYPLSIPSQMIQLAANDGQLKKRLYEWLNLLKGSIVESLAMAESARAEIDSLYNNLRNTLEKLNDMLQDDAKKLASAIENYSTLIKVYSENEKIYSNLADQNNLLVTANTNWCNQEMINYKTNHTVMESQLKVFSDLRFWLRKNFGRVRDWLKKKIH
jgi:DNA repair exonuclease SbcCD ATPase subunit